MCVCVVCVAVCACAVCVWSSVCVCVCVCGVCVEREREGSQFVLKSSCQFLLFFALSYYSGLGGFGRLSFGEEICVCVCFSKIENAGKN